MSILTTLRYMNHYGIQEITDWDEKAFIYDHSKKKKNF
jgi:hypothetical protein